jgi:hypothetical protein
MFPHMELALWIFVVKIRCVFCVEKLNFAEFRASVVVTVGVLTFLFRPLI